MRVQVEQPAFDWKDYLWAGTRGAVEFFVQFGIVLFLTFFLLISGDTFRRKLVVRITGPTLSKKKITLQVLDDIDRQIQRYLLVQVGTSTLVGLATWLAFRCGLQHAAVLGSAAGALNIIPYLGPVLATAGGAVVALLQFGTLDRRS